MKYIAGDKKIQYRCNKCKVVSPHNNKCFRCGSTDKTREVVPEIIVKRNKGQSINIKMR